MQKTRTSLKFLIFLPIISACALFGGGEESLHRAKNYRITPPKDWHSKETHSESDQAFQLPSGNVATITSSCKRRTDLPLEILTKHLLLGARNVIVEKKERYLVSGSEGLRTSVKAKLEGVPFNLELFVLPKNSFVFYLKNSLAFTAD